MGMLDIRKVRSTWIEIDLDAVTHNFLEIKKWLPEDVKLLVVLKANAYGHGAIMLARQYTALEADMIGVAILGEGIELRESKIHTPILVLGPSNPEQADFILDYDLQQTIFSLEMAKSLSLKAKIRDTQAVVHVKIDTGMGRLGISFNKAVDFIRALMNMERVKVNGIMTSFSTADEDDDGFLNLQIQRFKRVIDDLRKEKIVVPLVHAANSAALIREHKALFNMARPGIMIYGIPPSPHGNDIINLQPVLSLKTLIVDTRDVPAGTPIGYGRKFLTTQNSRIATIPIGYDDGYMRILSNKAHVLVKGQPAKIVGNICMDMCMVDITPVPGAGINDEVVLIGSQGTETIAVTHLAALANTIPYEFLCRISQRVPRVFKQSGKVVAIQTMNHAVYK